MPWWGKSSSKDTKKKANKESIIDAIHRRFKIASEENYNNRSGASQRCCSDTVSEKGSHSGVNLQSPPASIQVSRCQSFAERSHAQPLPLPGGHLSTLHHVDSQSSASPRPGSDRVYKPSLFQPIPNPGHVANGAHTTDADLNLGTASVSSDSSGDSDDPSDSRLLSPQASDYENVGKTTMNSSSSLKQKDRSPIPSKRNSRERSRPANLLLNNQIASTSPKQRPLGSRVPNLQIPPHGAYCSAPDSSMSSPSRSPMRVFGHEPVMNCGFWPGKPLADISLVGSGHCSSPGSGHNSGHNSVGGDMSGQVFWQHCRCSPECSAAPSPSMTSPGPSSRIHSGTVTPLHPRAAGAALESPMAWSDDGKQQSYRLPLPPATVSSPPPFYPSYTTGTNSMIPRSPGRAESPASPGSRWKKGRLLGRGTFGHVYLGFNSESGEMCAMKEVTLLSDDPKSKESAQQLGQEIALLSRLHHPNIVQYYGSETVDDKLYIYLEYVSGGSIYKLLQDYGQLGESAIRSYTQQILSGLAYLHSKNTVHRDIKGANILVDPSGRVKLADFGMAKHITGQSCPLSFKGSPYWMAPEVIKNSNGCNLAVDIWSLGCTVLEMATSKPPWSQYEGVAAMFKIGNSKELPPIPDHLSEEGKDFIRKCLQRNPTRRPTAARLLEHSFVKNSAPFERPILSPAPIEAMPLVKNSVRSAGTMNCRTSPFLDPEGAFHQTRGSKTVPVFSDAHMPRNISCPVSPIGRSFLHPQSPQHISGRLSPSPISSPHAASGSSTPLAGGDGAIPFLHPNLQMSYMYEGLGTMTRSQNSFYSSANNSYQDLKPDIFRGPSQAYFFQEVVPSESNVLRDKFGRPAYGNPKEQAHNGQSVLAERVSQQLLRNHAKLNPLVDLNPSSPVLGRNNGF